MQKQKKIIRKVALMIMYVLLSSMLMFNLYNILNKVLGNELPSYFGYSFLCLEHGEKMNMADGTLLVVARVPKDSVKEGQLLVFKYDDEIAFSKVLHILDGGEDGAVIGYVTSTIDTNKANAVVDVADVYGKVVKSGGGGNFLGFLISWQFCIILFACFMAIIWTHIIIIILRTAREEELKARIATYLKSNESKKTQGNSKAN